MSTAEMPIAGSYDILVVGAGPAGSSAAPGGGEKGGSGLMVDLSLFDKELAASAVLSGAKISMGTRAVEFSQEGVVIERGGKHEWVRAKVIIGADGARSPVAQWAGLPPVRSTIALQYEVVLHHPQDHVDIYFHKDYEGGYAWFFPKGKKE